MHANDFFKQSKSLLTYGVYFSFGFYGYMIMLGCSLHS